MWHTFLVDGDSDGSHLSSDLGVVNDGGSLRPLRGLASMQFVHLGIEGSLLMG
jgi:hypothetical protein